MSFTHHQSGRESPWPLRLTWWFCGLSALCAVMLFGAKWISAAERAAQSIRLVAPQFDAGEESTETSSTVEYALSTSQPAGIRLMSIQDYENSLHRAGVPNKEGIKTPPPAPVPGPTHDVSAEQPARTEDQAGRTPVAGSVPASPVSDHHVHLQGTVSAGHSFRAFAPGQSGYRATSEVDAQQWMSPYYERAEQPDAPASEFPAGQVLPLDPQFVPWWDNLVRGATGAGRQILPVDVAGLVRNALEYSPQVLAIKAEPHIQYHVLGQEAARFDWSTFLESTYNDLNEPVGNELAIGIPGEDRLKTEKFGAAGGVRRRLRAGGELEVSQRIGHEQQNSRFFTPNPQGSSRLELQFRQPLLNGSGRLVNESQIVLARIAQHASEDEVVGSLQDHLVQVTEAYWELYRARAEYFQRIRLLESATRVLRTLEGRNTVDTLPRQILRARAAVARSQTGIQRTLARVRDAEAQLRLLVNSPYMLGAHSMELTPVEAPAAITDTTPLRDVLNTALQNRPDISEAIRKMRASSLRVGVSRSDLLPRLDMIVSSYVADITRSSIPDSIRGQYRDNRPSYTVGLEFEVPIGNRAARAKYEQRKWEMARAVNIFRATVEKALTDVEIAHRDVATAWSEVLSRYQAMAAARNEAEYLQDRFDVLPMAEDSATLLLEDLLDALERLSTDETAFVQAQTEHALSIVRLRRENGTLLRTREGIPELNPSQAQWITGRVDAIAQDAIDAPLALPDAALEIEPAGLNP